MADINAEVRNEKNEEVGLEENFNLLEECVKKLSAEDIPLEEAFSLYEEGVRLLKKCNVQLDKVEKQVKILRENGETE